MKIGRRALTKVKMRGQTRADAQALIMQTPLALGLDGDRIDELLKLGCWVNLSSGQDLITQGDAGDSLYIILSGSVQAMHTDDEGNTSSLAVLPAGTIVGERAVLQQMARNATVRAIQACTAFEINTSAFLNWMRESKLKSQMARARIRLGQLAATAPLLREMPNARVKDLLQISSIREFPEGSTLIDQNATDRTVYLLLDGTVSVDVDNETVATLGVGHIVGEVALLSDSPRMASVTAIEDCLTLRFDAERFWSLLQQHPKLYRQISDLAKERILG